MACNRCGSPARGRLCGYCEDSERGERIDSYRERGVQPLEECPTCQSLQRGDTCSRCGADMDGGDADGG